MAKSLGALEGMKESKEVGKKPRTRKREEGIYITLRHILQAFLRTIADVSFRCDRPFFIFASADGPPLPLLFHSLQEVNRHVITARHLLSTLFRYPGVLGGCVLNRQRVLAMQLPAKMTSFILALLQPTQSTSYTEEDKRQIQRRGLKIREMMLRGSQKYIAKREYRLRSYNNSFVGKDMIDVLMQRGEVRSRDAGVKLGCRLLQVCCASICLSVKRPKIECE